MIDERCQGDHADESSAPKEDPRGDVVDSKVLATPSDAQPRREHESDDRAQSQTGTVTLKG